MTNKPAILNPKIESYLKTIKEDGRSSPVGMHWNDFFNFLRGLKKADHPDPPMPLILAASSESGATKHLRLSYQLYWALDNGCIDEALYFLENLEADKWNTCSGEKWHESSY